MPVYLISWLRLIRWKNLLIIFFTQLSVWACVIYPVRRFAGASFLLNFPNFLLISLATILIAAAGYIINDYFDIRIDLINKPEKMILEKSIPRRMAIIMHSVLNLLALLLAFRVAKQQGGSLFWLLFQMTCTLLLWFYSTHFKRRFMIGNVVVALLTAFTIAVLFLYEPAMHFYALKPPFLETPYHAHLPNPVYILAIYAFFAFVLTWMREIVKDMEDFKGDLAEGCVTMPIKWGLKKAAGFVIFLGITALIPLSFASIKLLLKKEWTLGFFTITGLIIPLCFWLLFLTRKASTSHYARASRYLKWIMVSGIFSLIIYYFEANA